MTREEVEEIVLEAVHEKAEAWGDRGPIPLTADLKEDLLMDPLEMVELVLAIEEGVGIDIQEDWLEKWITVGDVVTYLEGVL